MDLILALPKPILVLLVLVIVALFTRRTAYRMVLDQICAEAVKIGLGLAAMLIIYFFFAQHR